jgi:hypothetical protein
MQWQYLRAQAQMLWPRCLTKHTPNLSRPLLQSIQQEIAYRASAPAAAHVPPKPTPQERDATVAARMHRPKLSAAAAAAAAASQSGPIGEGTKKGKSAANPQQQRLQQRRQQQATVEGGTGGSDGMCEEVKACLCLVWAGG